MYEPHNVIAQLHTLPSNKLFSCRRHFGIKQGLGDRAQLLLTWRAYIKLGERALTRAGSMLNHPSLALILRWPQCY